MPISASVVCALLLCLLAVSHQALAQDKALDILPHYTTPAVELHIIVNRPSVTMGEAIELSFTIRACPVRGYTGQSNMRRGQEVGLYTV